MAGGLDGTAAITRTTGLAQFMGPTLRSSVHLPGLPDDLGVGSYLYSYDNGTYTPVGAGYYAFK
jgi:hypothetical protein